MTPSDRLRAMAEEEEKRADELEAGIPAIKAQIAGHREGAASLRKLADEMDSRLSVTAASSSMLRSKMELQNERVNKRVKIAAAMTGNATKAKRALLNAGLTPQDVADKRKVGRSTVDAWCRGTRSIPRADREWLRDKHGIPDDVWKKTAE